MARGTEDEPTIRRRQTKRAIPKKDGRGDVNTSEPVVTTTGGEGGKRQGLGWCFALIARGCGGRQGVRRKKVCFPFIKKRQVREVCGQWQLHERNQ